MKLSITGQEKDYLLNTDRAAKRIFGPQCKRKLAPPPPPNNDTQIKSTTVCYKQGRISTTKLN